MNTFRSSRSAAHYICRLAMNENVVCGAYYENGTTIDLIVPTAITVNNQLKCVDESETLKLLGNKIEKYFCR